MSADPTDDPAAVHSRLRQRFDAEVSRLARRENHLSTARLISFLGAAALAASGLLDGATLHLAAGGLLFVGFAVLVAIHLRVVGARDRAEMRRTVHERHLARLSGRWVDFDSKGETLLPSTHAYAWDVDLIGQGSLFQRIDVTHTVHGERTLADWLGAAAPLTEIGRRQAAVKELADMVELRQELEAGAMLASRHGQKLDGRPFLEFAALPSLFAERPWLSPVIVVMPLLTLAVWIAGRLELVPGPLWLLPLLCQIGLLASTGSRVRRAFDLAAARQGVVEAFERMLRVVEAAKFDSELLGAMQERLAVSGRPPSAHMARLRSWVTSAELRQQFLFHVFVNPLTLWDLHVLRGLEAWNREVGSHTGDWFDALGELEALCSLATLAGGDPTTTLPEVVASSEPLEAKALAHPLLPPAERVANDVALKGPSSALIVTGSNMAGKSTLLRAVGLNVALALAGGPVCAASMRVPLTRLRASMRAQDSLQQGASYFHAELTKLRGVVRDADAEPPIFFLLDELLRGTNARARHVGAKAVLLHLLSHRATGIVATHDVALSALETESSHAIDNVHFTDVVEDGEMRFDYRLRPGVVRTSNALRLLAMAGIAVPADERDALEGSGSPEVHPVPTENA